MTRWVAASRYVGALAGVGAVTLFIGLVLGRTQIANISMLYLAAVLGAAVYLGRGPAILAALASFVSFNWFFVEPTHHITVARPTDLFSLLLFLLTAVVTGQLAAAQRERAQDAREREREARVLYDVVRLTLDHPLDEGMRAVAEQLVRELRLDGVAIQTDGAGPAARVLVGSPEARATLQDPKTLARHIRGTPAAGPASRSAAPGRWVRVVQPAIRRSGVEHRLLRVPLTTGHEPRGSLLLLRRSGTVPFTPHEDRLVSATAAQLALALERAELRRTATDSEVLRRADEAKRSLLHAVSHDLRTPLSSIIAGATSLQQRDVAWTEPERDEFLANIAAEARRLDRLVANLLNFSRIESGLLEATKDWHDIASIIDDVAVRLRARGAMHRIIVDVEGDLPPVEVDYVEIEEVLTNLVENAIKYAPAESEVLIRASRAADAVRIEVLDRGPGVPTASATRIFEPFERGDAARPGTGLGLAVAKRFVEAHGGRIWSEQRAGGGSAFIFTLPVTG
ncbi:MAG TPA: DUF4118 domain-containing protein [Candidatus Limnocylindria bacterium]|nr:DUF4118 domain-containing protein [Candidatus Limnocylindria bacterium]